MFKLTKLSKTFLKPQSSNVYKPFLKRNFSMEDVEDLLPLEDEKPEEPFNGFELCFLGTASARATSQRATNSVALRLSN